MWYKLKVFLQRAIQDYEIIPVKDSILYSFGRRNLCFFDRNSTSVYVLSFLADVQIPDIEGRLQGRTCMSTIINWLKFFSWQKSKGNFQIFINIQSLITFSVLKRTWINQKDLIFGTPRASLDD